jgi:hypothetical protein
MSAGAQVLWRHGASSVKPIDYYAVAQGSGLVIYNGKDHLVAKAVKNGAGWEVRARDGSLLGRLYRRANGDYDFYPD